MSRLVARGRDDVHFYPAQRVGGGDLYPLFRKKNLVLSFLFAFFALLSNFIINSTLILQIINVRT